MRSNTTSFGFTALLAVITLALLVSGSPAAAQEKVLHAFDLNGKYGSGPSGSLIFDASGNLYGTTYAGRDSVRVDAHRGRAMGGEGAA
jgi:hypothetical protein